MNLISPEAIAVLHEAQCVGEVVKLPPEQLEREIYDVVNEVLTRLGGSWKRNKKGHVFPYDPAPLLQAVLATAEMPPKNPTAFFPTPKPVVDAIIEQIRKWHLHDGARILEPSAGAGAICDGLKALAEEQDASVTIDCVEILGLNRSQLETKGYSLVGDDFTTFEPTEKYHVVAMNPPFSLEGDKLAWLTHVKRAWRMVRENGCLAAIVPSSIAYRDTEAIRAFREECGLYGWWDEIEAGAFKESGTGIATALVWMEKVDPSWRNEPHNGWPNWHSWYVALFAENDYQSTEACLKATEKGADALREHLEGMAEKCRKAGDPVRLTPTDHQNLYKYFIDSYDLKAPELELIEAPVAAKPEVELGGLFAMEAA